MNRRRAPHPLLRPFVREVWSCGAEPVSETQARIERLLPSGFMHLVLRLDESPVHLLRSPDDAQGDALANAVLAGARTTPYLKRLHARSASVGATLLPGAAQWLFGLDADAIAGCHVPLEALLGAEARHLRARLVEAATVDARLVLFEAWLRVRRFQAAVKALAAREAPPPAELAATLGYSDQSHFIREFRAMAGLTPGRFRALAPDEPNHLPLVPPSRG